MDARAVGHDDHIVAGLQRVAAGGDDGLAVGPHDTGDQDLRADGQVLERHPGKGGVPAHAELQRFDLAADDAVQRLDVGTERVLHRADILQDRLCGDGRGGNDAVQHAVGGGQVRKGGAG